MRGSAQPKSIWLSKEFDRPLVTASYFGFTPIESPRLGQDELALRQEPGYDPHYDPAEIASLVKGYQEYNLSTEPHPLSISYKRSLPGRGADKYLLHFIGSNQGVADAALIRSALSILEGLGHKKLIVGINSIGDKDSQSAHERELGLHIRKHASNLSQQLREEIKRDIWSIFHLPDSELEKLRASAPPSLSFLSAQSRNHFKDVLEYIEALGVEFELEHSLVGHHRFSSHTVYSIRDMESGGNVVAAGCHYGRLAKRLGFKKEVPVASMTIFTSPEPATVKIKVYKDLPKPKFCLIHLGREAKMRSLPILEELRREHIRVHHLLGKDKIAVQLSSAESQPVSHIIIIGHKEALENTVTVRNIATRAQDTIPASKLCYYLKRL